MGYYYIIFMDTIGYIILIVIGVRMHRFVQKALQTSPNVMKTSANLNSQFTRTLLIQVLILINRFA